jgi:hypothetical protein
VSSFRVLLLAGPSVRAAAASAVGVGWRPPAVPQPAPGLLQRLARYVPVCPNRRLRYFGRRPLSWPVRDHIRPVLAAIMKQSGLRGFSSTDVTSWS